MEEDKKVFIRGRKGRGDEIKNILTGLGATATALRCDSDALIYFINHDNEIDCTNVCTEKAHIIMDNYREIELPPRPWKDGDILAFDFTDRGVYAVFKKYTGKGGTFESYILVNDDDMRLGVSCPTGAYHLANNVEKEDFRSRPTGAYHLANNVEKEDFRSRYNFMMSLLKSVDTVLNKDAE